MEMELRQGRDTIEDKNNELHDLQTQFKSVSQQLHSERQLIGRKNREIDNAERAIEELTTEQTRLTGLRDRQILDARKLIGEKEREIREKVTVCESLEAELIQKEKEVHELQKILNDKDTEITELHKAQHKAQQDKTDLEEAKFHSPDSQLQQLGALETELYERKQAMEHREKELETLQTKLKTVSQELHSLRQRKTLEFEGKLREELDQELRRLTETKDRETLNAQRAFKEKEMILQQKVGALEAELLEKEKSVNKKADAVKSAHEKQKYAQNNPENPTEAANLARRKSLFKQKRFHPEGREALTSEDAVDYGELNYQHALRHFCIHINSQNSILYIS